MKLERKKNAKRNIFFGILNKLVTVLFPFALRTVLVYTLGAEYLGLSSLFTSVLQVLSLSELGIGSAMVFNMYKPIAEDNTDEIVELTNLYKNIYRIIGCVIFFGGMAFLPFLNNFIKGEVPEDVNVYVLFMLYLINSSESYFISAYRSTILNGHQRRDIIMNISLITHVLLYLAQILCLIRYKDYYLYIIWLPVFTTIENLITAVYVKKKYPQYVIQKKVNFSQLKGIFANVKDLFGHKLSQVVTVSVDTIVISTFLGLQMVTIYNNYYYLLFAVVGFLDVAYQGILAGIGNSIVIDTKRKNYKDFEKFDLLNSWIIGWCSICFLCLYQPFIKIWMGEDLMLPWLTVCLMVIYFYVWKIRQMILIYKDAAGMWDIDRYKPYVEIVFNLTLNIILVQMIGINGVVISTILSMLLISLPWETRAFFKAYFKKSTKEYNKKRLIYLLITLLFAIPTYIMCSYISVDGIVGIVIRFLICIAVPNTLMIIIFGRITALKEVIAYILSMFIKDE